MKKIAVFMLFGQSNAVGHAMPMDEKDYINVPLKNVFGLNRDPNQSYDITELKFTGYTSFGMNLAETQDNTYSVANCLARRWQDEIDSGNPNNLPDLYIIHIAIGSQGLLDMWNMRREKVMKPGILGTVDISMYPLATLVLNLFNKYCKDNDLEPDYVGLHWRGGEQEVRRGIDYLEEINLKNEYIKFFTSLRACVNYDVPVVVHKMPFEKVFTKEDPSGGCLATMHYINDVFAKLSNELKDTTVFDPTRCPYYDADQWDFGIFRWDLIHYQGRVNDWVAGEILEEYKKR